LPSLTPPRPPSLGEEFYREALEHCRSYNARLCAERSLRLPFLDAQTGVAQGNCYIWMEKTHRGPALLSVLLSISLSTCLSAHPSARPPSLCVCLQPPLTLKVGGGGGEGACPCLFVPHPLVSLSPCPLSLCPDPPAPPPQKPPPPEFPHDPEGDELEDDTPRRKNKAKSKACGLGAVRRRQEAALEDRDKPYVCDSEWDPGGGPGEGGAVLTRPPPPVCSVPPPVCGKRYKNRPGLSYHYTHTHLAEEEGDEHGGERLGPPRRNHHRREPGRGR
ncbi:DPF1 protein, partial [Alopecoenas beccarii]|nr:DPF1 protein [Alopecoenas beccarii]